MALPSAQGSVTVSEYAKVTKAGRHLGTVSRACRPTLSPLPAPHPDMKKARSECPRPDAPP